MTTGLDAGLRVGEDSILVVCEDGNFKFVIYDNDSRDKDIIAIYKTDQVYYNIKCKSNSYYYKIYGGQRF